MKHKSKSMTIIVFVMLISIILTSCSNQDVELQKGSWDGYTFSNQTTNLTFTIDCNYNITPQEELEDKKIDSSDSLSFLGLEEETLYNDCEICLKDSNAYFSITYLKDFKISKYLLKAKTKNAKTESKGITIEFMDFDEKYIAGRKFYELNYDVKFVDFEGTFTQYVSNYKNNVIIISCLYDSLSSAQINNLLNNIKNINE